MDTRVAVIYYSATGNVHGLATAIAEGSEVAGAEVRVRHVEELASELMISQNQYWGRHRSIVGEEPVATLADLEWADGIAFGTPTRFGNVAAQLKQLIAVAGRQARGQSRDELYVLTDRTRRPGIHDPGAQQHLLSLGHGRASAGLHGARGIRCGRQPVRGVVCQRAPGDRAG
jgi:NAD(P)H-dependent FMN reductase